MAFGNYKKLQDASLHSYQKLVTDENVLQWSLYAVRFAVFADCVNGMILQPNYAIMVDPNAHEESFPSTNPFDFSSATYFIPMTSLLGTAIASSITGTLSDKLGRKPVILFCLSGSMVGSTVKYFLRQTFWGFCIANFFNGLLSGSLPVALAYISDVFTSNKIKASQFSIVVGCWVLGQSIGGIIAILMSEQGLFAPLWVGVGIMFLACCVTAKYLVEASNLKIPKSMNESDDDEDEDLPTEINKMTMYHIIIGALADTIGSKALFPLCLSPLAFTRFYKDFINEGLPPIMSLNTYQWLSVLVAFVVIPSSIMTPHVFRKIGLAGGCVAGNTITGVLTIILLYIAMIDPPTHGSFVGFAVALYVGYPFTVMSQLSTSPMLDRISPVDKRGYVQGTYTTFLNIGNALAPWLLGLLADGTSVTVAIWTGIGVSFGASLINAPLMFKKEFGPSKKEVVSTDLYDVEEMTLSEEEEQEWEEKVANGEYIPAHILSTINFKRIREKSLTLLVPPIGNYQNDKETLDKLRLQAKDDFKFLRNRSHNLLSKKDDPELPQFVNDVNEALKRSVDDALADDLGKWIVDYMKDSGYVGGVGSPQTLKMMVLKAFPVLFDEGRLTVNNFEEALVNSESVYNHYLKRDAEGEREYGLQRLFRRPMRRFHG
mmetsp:Transcript_14728/g.17935  ORF Transcript_14728/g.17935 Transcript_14728/m.17935 type:complete len:658 (-) Transcript_14728:262-2235(-)